MLTPRMMQAIVDIVAADAECRRRISSVIGKILPDALTFSGDVRDLVLGTKVWLTPGASINDPENAMFFCSGIADAAVKAINNGRRWNPYSQILSRVLTVERIDRMPQRPRVKDWHSGVLVKTVDGGEYVFDWWKTQDIRNPFVQQAFDFRNPEVAPRLGHTFRGHPGYQS